MPKPNPGESRDDFVERCIPVVIDDGTAEDSGQAVAICNSIWRERSVSDSNKHEQVLNAIRSRRNRRAEFGYGITTADQYVRKTLDECPGIPNHGLLMKEAEGKLTYANPDMVLVKEDMTATAASFGELLPDGVQPPEHTLMVFQHVLTTSREDRDKDVLVTDGAMLDPKAPLLWQHMQTMLVGKVLATINHTPDLLRVATVLLDLKNRLTDDAAKLIEAEALRISHGFRALEFEERKQEPGDGSMMPGFRITKFEIMEASLVSVPSNVDAVIDLYSSGKLASDFFKSQAKHFLAARPAQVAGHKATTSAAPAGSQMTLKLGDYSIDVKASNPDDAIKMLNAAKKEEPSGPDTSVQSDDRDAGRIVERYGADVAKAMDPTFKTVQGCKNFQPEMEHLEASQIEYDWAAKFLGCEIKDLIVTGTFVSHIRAGSYLYAEAENQKEWEKRDQRNLTRDGKQEPLRHDVIALNSERSQTFMVDGIEFWKLPQDKKLVVKHEKTWRGYEIVIYSKDESGNEFMNKCWEWARENNFLKGEAFSLTGKFINRKGQELDDVFLEPKNHDAVSRAVKLINGKGQGMKSRGQVYMGPPGTGKTLSCRVLLNQAKCSFIWITPKDFWQLGTTNGICHAFDLAAELAPAIVCFEDVDNHMRYSVDLLKTEMDGLDQKGGILTIMTTNYPEKFPDALLDRPGRFHDICEFHLPTEKVRLQMLQRWSITRQVIITAGKEDEQKEFHVAETDLVEIAKQTKGYSGAHMYELCEFAKTLKDDDDLEMKAALTKSLEKIEEQRSLIDQTQLAGSTYKPSRSEQLSVVKALGFQGNEDWSVDIKGGRVISDKHLKVLKAVHSDLETMSDMDKMPRAGQAICESCITKLGTVIDAASIHADEDKPKPKPDDEDKLYRTFNTHEAGAKHLLATDDLDLLETTKQSIEAILRVKQLDGKAEEYRHAIAN